jgi:hypothetical protein
MVKHQLAEQEDFILSIKLHLAQLNKSYQERFYDLAKEKTKVTNLQKQSKSLREELASI